jgi:hypothetical protein
VDVSEVHVADGGSLRSTRERDLLDNVGIVFFNDPDRNRRAVQQISAPE